MFPRGRVDLGGNDVRAQGYGDVMLSQNFISALTTAGAGSITAALMAGGIIRRTGPTGGYTDTFDTAANICIAMGSPNPGDSFRLMFINGVAQAMTAAGGEGIILGTNVDVAASLVREYLVTVLSGAPRQVFTGSTTNTSVTVSGLTAAQVDLIQPGMGISGTGIAALTIVVGKNPAAGTITLDTAATATGTVSLVFFPRVNISGLRAGTA